MECILCASAAVDAFKLFSHFILTTTLQSKYLFNSHITIDKTMAQKLKVAVEGYSRIKSCSTIFHLSKVYV